MPTPTLSSIFQIGTDNALITAPQKYTIPANPPSQPNPPTSLTTTVNETSTSSTSDSVTLYASAIQGFANPLYLSFFIRKIDSTIDPNLPPADSTTVPADGDPLPIEIGTTSSNLVGNTGTWDGTYKGWKGKIWMDDAHTQQATLTPNASNSLNTYIAQNFRTLWINAQTTGGAISPNHPPSYQVNIYALDTISNTYTACSFTLVVQPSLVNYGLGVYCVDTTGKTFINSVAIVPSGSTDVFFQFYPLEPTYIQPADINITIDTFASPIIDGSTSTVNGVAFNSFTGLTIPAGTYTRDTGLELIPVHLVLNGSANPNGDNFHRKALFQFIGTDTNGVTVSAYVVITVVSS